MNQKTFSKLDKVSHQASMNKILMNNLLVKAIQILWKTHPSGHDHLFTKMNDIYFSGIY